MKIGNIRLGLATNSSSTHYLVFLNNNQKYSDTNINDQTFGWENFILASKESKETYLAQILYQNLLQDVGTDIAKIVTEKLCNCFVDEEGYIDHQSLIALPNKFINEDYYNKSFFDKTFFEELQAYILKDNAVIFGGNDNDDDKRLDLPCEEKAISIGGITQENKTNALVCRKDDETGVWFLFNKETGARLTVSFNDSENMLPTVPLLVDLKITDMCPYSCSFCYQNSNKLGKHADIRTINDIIFALSSLKVFEVSIGGGDPTEHPKFKDILHTCRYSGMVPNFSTRNSAFIESYLEEDNGYGAVAFSSNGNNLRSFFESLIKHNLLEKFIKRGVIHHVVGTSYNIKQIFETIRYYNSPLILLGYKNVGRGKNCRPIEEGNNWINIFKEVCSNTYVWVGIDTLLAKQFEDKLKDNKVSERLYSIKESDSSLYIDAVNGLIGPSSYCDKEQMIKVDFDHMNYEEIAKLIKETFLKFRCDFDFQNKLYRGNFLRQ